MQYQSMGIMIQSLRKKENLTQRDLAEQLNVTDKAVSKWERDIARPDITLLPKLAAILNVSVEDLINAQIAETASPAPATQTELFVEDEEENEDFNENYWYHKERSHQLLKQGLWGLLIGLALATFITFTTGESPQFIWLAIIPPFFIGCPYGYELLNRLFGQWVLFANIIVILFLSLAKFGFCVIVGVFAYPIALAYHLTHASTSRKTVKKRWIIAILIGLLLFLSYFILTLIDDSSTQYPEETTVPTVPVSAESLDSHPTILEQICADALSNAQAQESQDSDLGWKILEPAEIKCVYFLNAENSNRPHHQILADVYLSNAVFIVTGYYVEIDNMMYDIRYEWDIWCYPNFTFNDNNELQYESDENFRNSLASETLEDVKNWIAGEYDDMIITELQIPAA